MAPAGGRRRLAIVPARGGSKGLPGKNLAVVGGKTLVARAVETAVASGLFDFVLVSTEDPTIAAEGRRAGGSTPFLRPAPLAGDRSAIVDAVKDALVRLAAAGQAPFDLVVLLEPTSPMRDTEILRRTVQAAESEGADAAFTVSPVPARFHALKQFHIGRGNIARFAHPEGGAVANRQELEPSFVRNGLCYAVRRSALDAGLGLLGANPRAIVVEGPIVNIDDAEDLALARRLLEPASAG
jgi:CMP-N-acetylneuraminic acid synthetase